MAEKRERRLTADSTFSSFSAASGSQKAQYMEKQKHKLRQKLEEVFEEKQNAVSSLEQICTKIQSIVESAITEMDSKEFLRKHRTASSVMEDVLEWLVTMNTSLYDQPFMSSEDNLEELSRCMTPTSTDTLVFEVPPSPRRDSIQLTDYHPVSSLTSSVDLANLEPRVESKSSHPQEIGLGVSLGRKIEATVHSQDRVFTPSYFSIKNIQMTQQVLALEGEITLHYNQMHMDHLPTPIPDDRLVAVRSKCDNRWHRGRVTDLAENGTVNIFYVDYGNFELVAHEDIRPLASDFKYLSHAANIVSLRKVRPNFGSEWSERAIDQFFHLVFQKLLIAEMFPSQSGITNVQVDLILKEAGVNVAEELVRMGYAEFQGEAKPPQDTWSIASVQGSVFSSRAPSVTRSQAGGDPQDSVTGMLQENWSNISVAGSWTYPPTPAVSLSGGQDADEFERSMKTDKWKAAVPGKVSPPEHLKQSPVTPCKKECSLDSIEHSQIDEPLTLESMVPPSSAPAEQIENDESRKDVTVGNSILDSLPVEGRLRPNLSTVSLVGSQDRSEFDLGTDTDGEACIFTEKDGAADRMKEDYEEAELVRVVPRSLKPEEEFEMVTFLKIAELSEPNGSNVVFSHVESPGDFSVYEVNDKVLQVDNLREEMQNFYAGGQRLPKPCLKEGLFIVAFFPDDGFWYRAQILTKKGSEYQVLYVDYGNQATVNEPQIKPLLRQFAVLPALTIRCKLAEIAPISGDEWTEPVKLFFQEVAPAMNHVFVRVIDRDLDGILSVIAVDESRGDGLSYNKLLVQEGYAAYLYDTNGQLEGPGKEMKQEDELNWKDFDPMKEDFESRRNAYDYDVDDAGIAITGHKAQDEATVCKFFRSNKPCPRRDLCPFRHILLPEDGMTTDQKEIYNNIPKPEIPCDDTLLMVQVTAMYHPSHFYVNFPRGIGNLRSNDLNLNGLMDAGSSLVEEFSRELHEHYDKRRFMSSIHEVPALSEIIVACSPGDKRWYRARVIGYGDDQEGMVKVFYLDMGFMEMVPEKDLRILDPKFASTPALALECRLFGVLPSVGFKWSSVAKSYFMSLISSTLDTFPILAWIEGWDQQEDVLLVSLFAVRDKVQNIGAMLVEKGLARRDLPERRFRDPPIPAHS